MGEEAVLVLVVDDDIALADMIQSMLKHYGYRVRTTSDSREALELARSLMPDLILCDTIMPGQTGGEVVFSLKADAATAHIPVILMTGGARTFEEIACAGFLGKPFTPTELKAAVENVLRVRVKTGGP